NRGRGMAAGVMSGAGLVGLVLQRPFPGRVAQVGGGGSLAGALQGSGVLVRASTGGAGCNATTKGLTGIAAPMIAVLVGERGECLAPLCWFPGRERIQRMKEASAGAEPSFVSGMTTDRRRVVACRRRFGSRNGYEMPYCYF